MSLRILAIEQEPGDAQLWLQRLGLAGLQPGADVAQTPEESTARLHQATYDVVVVGAGVSRWTGTEPGTLLRALGFDLPVIFVSQASARRDPGETAPDPRSPRARFTAAICKVVVDPPGRARSLSDP